MRLSLVAAVVALPVVASLVRAAEVPGPPWAMAVSQTGITLRWWADDLAEPVAGGVAAAFCGASGRRAEVAALERDGSAAIGRYRCR